MSSYFDNIRRQVSDLSRECPHTPEGTEAFLNGVKAIESTLIRDCELFAGDIETPEDVRSAVITCIALNEVRYDGGDFLGGKLGDTLLPSKGAQHAAMSRSSLLESQMHSLWHDIGRMRYQMRYGPVTDNPEWAVKRRDAYAAEKQNRTKPFSDKPPLVCADYRMPVAVAKDREHLFLKHEQAA